MRFDASMYSSVSGEGGLAREVLPTLRAWEWRFLLVNDLFVNHQVAFSVVLGKLGCLQSGEETTS